MSAAEPERSMGADGIKPLSRAEELCAKLCGSADSAPLAEMEELLRLAREDAAAAAAVRRQLDLLNLVPALDDPGFAWLMLVAGELGRDGALAVLKVSGRRGKTNATVEAAVSVLQRRILDVLPEMLCAVHLSRKTRRRRVLYEALEAAIVLGDGNVWERLRQFALERLEVEIVAPYTGNIMPLVCEPLMLLGLMGDARVPDLIERVRALCQPGDDLDGGLYDLEEALKSSRQHLSVARRRVQADWMQAAVRVEETIGLACGILSELRAREAQ